MQLQIPFFPQRTHLDCGTCALRMVLAYFGRDLGIETLIEKTGIKEGKALHTIQIATAATSLGYKSKFYSKTMNFNEQSLEHEFYKKYGVDMNIEASNLRISEAKKVGVEIEEKTFPLEELLGFLTEESIPIVLLDWSIVKGTEEKGYQGHFVPIVGYDETNVYVHNQGLSNPQSFLPIKREVFDKSRKASGTDEDVAIIYKN